MCDCDKTSRSAVLDRLREGIALYYLALTQIKNEDYSVCVQA